MSEDLIDVVAAWARAQPDIHAALLVGSHARSETPADEWSDIDVTLVADDPSRYTDRADWVGDLGEPIATFVEPASPGPHLERRVLFASGQDVDLSFIRTEEAEAMRDTGVPEGPAAVVRRGFRILFDELGLREAVERAAASSSALPQRPAGDAFCELVNEFWYTALWAARKLARGELWVARSACECGLKAKLGVLLEWQARARDHPVDTWHRGRFLESWADPAVLEDLPATVAPYDAPGLHTALVATVHLFERVSRMTAAAYGFSYPVLDHDRVLGWIGELRP